MSGTTGLIIVGAHSRLGYVHYRQGRYDEAIREYRRELEMLSVGDHLLRERTSIELQQKLGAAYRRHGDLAPAESHENERSSSSTRGSPAGADEPFTRYYLAALHALRGDAERRARASRAAADGARRVHALAPAARSGLRSGASQNGRRCFRMLLTPTASPLQRPSSRLVVSAAIIAPDLRFRRLIV